MKNKIAVIVTAAGTSSRLDLGVKKEFLPLKNGTVLSESVKSFVESCDVQILVVTYLKGNLEETKKALFSDSSLYKKLNFLISEKNLILNFSEGEETRQKSVFSGLKSIEKIILSKKENLSEYSVLIHDGARPFVSSETIQNVISATAEFGSEVPGRRPTDSVVQISEDGFMEKAINRDILSLVQTPQGFLFENLFEAYKKSLNDNNIYTDDTAIWQKYVQNAKTKIVPGSEENIKITFKNDLRNLF